MKKKSTSQMSLNPWQYFNPVNIKKIKNYLNRSDHPQLNDEGLSDLNSQIPILKTVEDESKFNLKMDNLLT